MSAPARTTRSCSTGQANGDTIIDFAGNGAGAGDTLTFVGFGTAASLGKELFMRFYYPFEAISLLLIVAMIGAVLLAKRKLS